MSSKPHAAVMDWYKRHAPSFRVPSGLETKQSCSPIRMPLTVVLQCAESLFAYSVVFVQDPGSGEPWLCIDHWQPDPG